MGDFKKLDAWRKTQKLVTSIYRLTSAFPSVERFGLTAQMRRAAVSVTANLAEGCGRQGDAELRRFIRISLGSLAELECELLVAVQLDYLPSKTCAGVRTEIRLIRSMLQRLHTALPSARTKRSTWDVDL